MSDAYTSGEYAAKNPSWHLEHSPRKAAQVRRMLAKHALQPRRLAEVGCGAGGILEALRNGLEPRPDCTGYEISPQVLQLAKAREAEGLRFQMGSPEAGGEPSDVVLAMDVLEHVENYLGFIRSLQPIARWKIHHIALDMSVVSLIKPEYLQMAREHVGHLHYFTRETALASVEAAGLTIQDWFYTSVELDQGAHGQKRLHQLRESLFRWKPDLAVRWPGGFSVLVLAQ